MPQSPAGAVGPTVTVRPNVSRTSSLVIRTSVPTAASSGTSSQSAP